MISAERELALGTEYAKRHTAFFTYFPEGELFFKGKKTTYRVVRYKSDYLSSTTVEASYESAKVHDALKVRLCILYLEGYGPRWFSCNPDHNREYKIIYDSFFYIDNLPVG